MYNVALYCRIGRYIICEHTFRYIVTAYPKIIRYILINIACAPARQCAREVYSYLQYLIYMHYVRYARFGDCYRQVYYFYEKCAKMQKNASKICIFEIFFVSLYVFEIEI